MFDKIVYEQYEEVRKSGLCNMLNKNCVISYADSLGFDKLIGIITAGKYIEVLKTYAEAKEKGWI